MLKKCN